MLPTNKHIKCSLEIHSDYFITATKTIVVFTAIDEMCGSLKGRFLLKKKSQQKVIIVCKVTMIQYYTIF